MTKPKILLKIVFSNLSLQVLIESDILILATMKVILAQLITVIVTFRSQNLGRKQKTVLTHLGRNLRIDSDTSVDQICLLKNNSIK